VPIYADIEKLAGGDANDAITKQVILASGYAELGRASEARAHLDALGEIVARYPAGAGEMRTPRGLIGGPVHLDTLNASLLLDVPEWIGLVEAEIRTTGRLPAGTRSHVAAARAIVAGDTAAAARHLDAAWSAYEHVGFAGMHVRAILMMISAASNRGLRIGAGWTSSAARTRAFAERASAKWWLSVLERAGL
jgi:hypothetical protein